VIKIIKNICVGGLICIPLIAFGGTEKYCIKNQKKFDIHIFGYTYDNDSQRQSALQGLTKIKNEFTHGSKVRVFTHTPNGVNVSMEACVPGCNVGTSMSDQFFSSDCSAQIAKRDFIEFDKKFSSIAVKDIVTKYENYDIFQAIQSLSDVYKNTQDQSNVYAVISMIPKGVNPTSRSDLNSLLVKKSESIVFPKSFPPVQLVGSSNNEELIKFWRDIFRNKAKFNFQGF
jgi:hypothetical protein